MKIRKAESFDVSKLFALEQKLFSSANFPLSRGSLAYHVKNNMLLVAEAEGEMAGYVLALVKRSHAKLYSIGVCEAYRGKKIAFKLLEALSAELISLGFSKLLLEVRVDNERAIALYKDFGFILKKQLKAFYRDGCDAYLMELQQY
jgi:[ribosomal protein S18]-alanine N-acetyltransferase